MSAYKFLGILNTPSPSHCVVGSALFKELASRGHEVTLISPFSLKKPITYFREILTPSVFTEMKENLSRLLDLNGRTVEENALDFHNIELSASKAFLEEPEVRALMRSNENFDVIVCEVYMSESLFGLSEHLIGLNARCATTPNTDLVVSPSPPSYVPFSALDFTDRMSLVERIDIKIFERGVFEFYYLPKQAAIYKQYFLND